MEVLGVVLGGAIAAVLYTQSQKPDPGMRVFVQRSSLSVSNRNSRLEARDVDAPDDRLGAHHLATEYGGGTYLYFTPELMKFLRSQ